MSNNFIPVNTPLIGARERELVNEALDTGWISSEGPFVSQFENAMATRVGRKSGVAVSNGTAALEIAVRALEIGPGDEVILPAFTIISCAEAVVKAGATPVTVDCDSKTWNMAPEEVEAAVNSRTRAIMVVHIYGLTVDIDPILDIAERHGLAVIEDAAEAIGQTYRGRACGSFGDISTFSFYANKHITTGEGGMVLTDDLDLAERCRKLRNLCFEPGRRFVHKESGWNYRLTNLQAALGVAQLEKLDETTSGKRRMGARYQAALEGCSSLQLPIAATDYCINDYWVFGLLLKEGARFRDAEEFAVALNAEGVGTRPFFWPIHRQPLYMEKGMFEDVSHPVAESLTVHGLYLPSSVGLPDSQIDEVAAKVRHLIE
jgi:perosamine synthetase